MTTATPDFRGIVWGIPAVADPASEFFRSIGFLRLAALQADGAMAKGTRMAMERLRPRAADGLDFVPSWLRSVDGLGELATRLIAEHLKWSTVPLGPIRVLSREETR